MDAVYITKDARDVLRTAVMAVTTEIGGFGYAKQDDQGRLVWYETFLVPQEVSKSEVDYDETGGIHYAVEKAMIDGVLDDPSFCWVKWHSHGELGVHWSGTDDTMNYHLYSSGIKRLIDHVTNRKGDSITRVELYDVKHAGIVVPQITLDKLPLVEFMNAELRDKVLQDVKDMVKEKHDSWGTGHGNWGKGTSSSSSSSSSSRKSDPGDKVERALDKRDDEVDGMTLGDLAYEAWEDENIPVVAHPALDVASEVIDLTNSPSLRMDEHGVKALETSGWTVVWAGFSYYMIPLGDLEAVLKADTDYLTSGKTPGKEIVKT